MYSWYRSSSSGAAVRTSRIRFSRPCSRKPGVRQAPGGKCWPSCCTVATCWFVTTPRFRYAISCREGSLKNPRYENCRACCESISVANGKWRSDPTSRTAIPRLTRCLPANRCALRSPARRQLPASRQEKPKPAPPTSRSRSRPTIPMVSCARSNSSCPGYGPGFTTVPSCITSIPSLASLRDTRSFTCPATAAISIICCCRTSSSARG